MEPPLSFCEASTTRCSENILCKDIQLTLCWMYAGTPQLDAVHSEQSTEGKVVLSNPAEPLTSGNLPYTHKYACDITPGTMPHLRNNL